MTKIKKIICLALCVTTLSIGSLVAYADTTNNDEINSQEITVNETEKNVINEDVSKEDESVKQEDTDLVENAENPDVEKIEAADDQIQPTEADVPQTTTSVAEPAQTELTYEVADSDASVSFNGELVTFDTKIKKLIDSNGGETNLVPLRKIAELLNCTVAWRQSDETVHVFCNGKSKMFTVGKPQVEVHDFEVTSKFVYTTEAQIIKIAGYPIVTEENRTLVPIRAISEILGATVNYDGEQKLIGINAPEDMLNYTATISDIKARNYIETYNYYPTVELKTGSISVRVYGNFMNADPTLGDGVTVSVDGKTQTAANGGTCQFADVKAGTYTVSVSNIPEGYKADDVSVVVEAGQQASVNISLVKVEEKTDEAKEEVKEEATKSDVKSK